MSRSQRPAVSDERDAARKKVERTLRRGDLDGAIAEYTRLLEEDPEDWATVNALGDVLLLRGEHEPAIARFRSAADYYREEGFLAKAAAIYRKILRVRPDDHALLCLGEIAARQGRLAEARRLLLELAAARRERGDLAGCEEVLASLQAVMETPPAEAVPLPSPPPSGPENGRTSVATKEDTEEMSTLHEPADAPTDAPAEAVANVVGELQRGDEMDGGSVELSRVATTDVAPEPVVREQPTPRLPPRGRRLPSKKTAARRGASPRARSLQSVFDQMRHAVEQEDGIAAAHEQFDLAQYHLRDGRDDEAMTALRRAAQAPPLRFKASAQLGRLYISRGELGEGIEWLERAAQLPPVSPDEGHAVLYELGDALERGGEGARALAVFIELAAQYRRYRDVQERIARLSGGGDGA